MPDGDLQAAVVGGALMDNAAPLNAALHFVKSSAHTVFGHAVVTKERRDAPRGLGLHLRTDVQIDLVFRAPHKSPAAAAAVALAQPWPPTAPDDVDDVDVAAPGSDVADYSRFPGSSSEQRFRKFVHSVAAELQPFLGKPIVREPEPEPEPDDDDEEDEDKPPPIPNPDPRRELSLEYLLVSGW